MFQHCEHVHWECESGLYGRARFDERSHACIDVGFGVGRRYLHADARFAFPLGDAGSDVELVRAVRAEFGDIPLFVDANGAYGPEDIEIFRRLDEFNLMMFEQPFPGPDLEQLAWLQAQVKTPVCLDESLESAGDLRRAIELGSLRIANFNFK